MKYSILIIPIVALAVVGANMIEPPPRSATWTIENETDLASFFGGDPLNLPIDTASTTLPTRKPDDAQETLPFLAHYPFSLVEPNIVVAEGFAAYDGYLGDTRGEYHKGIDYVRKRGNSFLPFEVYTIHHGEAWRGEGSETWGEFVIVRRTLTPTLRYYTIYAHLEHVPKHIPLRPREPGVEVAGAPVRAGEYVGLAGNTGNTKGVPQLHLELHEENLAEGTWLKLDPYGVYSTKSSRSYPDPGTSLEGLEHYWVSDTPRYAP